MGANPQERKLVYTDAEISAKFGPQRWDRQMMEMVDSQPAKSNGQGYPTEKQLDEQLKNAVLRNPVTKPMQKNDAQRAYEKEKVLNENKPKSIDDLVGDLRKTTKNSFRKKKAVPPLCDYRTAKRLVWEAYQSYAEDGGFEAVITPGMREILPMLTAYFTGNKTEAIDPSKGIYLWGPVGTGKTVLFEVMQKVMLHFKYPRRFKKYKAHQVISDVATSKTLDIEKYFYGSALIDDLGFGEDQVKHYGNTIRVFETILARRYENYIHGGTITHVTSNLPWSGAAKPEGNLSNQFSDRIASRGSEMWNFIILRGEDLRKKRR